MDVIGSVGQSAVVVNTAPAVLTGATAFAANPKRTFWFIQNQGTNQLYVMLGAGCTTSQYHAILKGCSGPADGTGGTISSDIVVFTGVISVAGTSPSYTVLEI